MRCKIRADARGTKCTTETRNPLRISEKSSKNLRVLGDSVVSHHQMAKVLKIFLLGVVLVLLAGTGRAAAPQAIQSPVLKWSEAGCYSSWCERGWYSSPAVADLDGDGTMEVIGGAYSLAILDGESGALEKRLGDYSHRVWPGVVVADLDGDGDLEIVAAKGGGNVYLYDHQGDEVWAQHVANNEFRSLSVGDLDNDDDLEIVIGQAKLDQMNTWVLEHTGSIRPGWPQITDTEGSAAGLYNDNIGLGDVDDDGRLEVFSPSDTITIAAYDADGNALPTNPMYHDHPDHDMDFWAEVPAYIDLAYEIRGWGPCYTETTARANFANGPANVVDVNGDGINEVVMTGDVHDCHTSPYTDLYNTPYILNADRSRFDADGFDWTTPPVDTGAPVIQDYNIIESVQPNPVTVDLDGDGNLEILFPSYDGRMHAFWLDKTEHGNWPYAVYTGGVYRFASEPVVADLDNDGYAEVIFASWAQKGSNQTGKLHILDYLGNVLYEVPLPPPKSSSRDWNGALAAPTLANIDADAALEVVLNTANAGFVAYDLPGTENARILWGTGRGNYQRTGTPPDLTGSLAKSRVEVRPLLPGAGEVLSYTIQLENSGLAIPSATVTSTLPAQVAYRGDVWASSGSASESGGVITWSGEVGDHGSVTITYSAQVDAGLSEPTVLVNRVLIADGQGTVWERRAVAVANGFGVYLPLVFR